MWSRTSGPDLADVLDRGRTNFDSLSGSEKIIFGNYHNEMVLTSETMIVLGKDQALDDQLALIPHNHLRYYFGLAFDEYCQRISRYPLNGDRRRRWNLPTNGRRLKTVSQRKSPEVEMRDGFQLG